MDVGDYFDGSVLGYVNAGGYFDGSILGDAVHMGGYFAVTLTGR